MKFVRPTALVRFSNSVGPWTSTRSNCARCTAKSSSSASVLAGLRFAADGEMRLRFQGSKKTDQRRGQNTRQRLSYQIAERTSIHMSMRCQNVRTKQNTHELEIINIRLQQAVREPSGISHFDGECRTCFSSYWQHGWEIILERWRLKPATCQCGCA